MRLAKLCATACLAFSLLGCTDLGVMVCDAFSLEIENCELMRAVAKLDDPLPERENYVQEGSEKFQPQAGFAIYQPKQNEQAGYLSVFALPTTLAEKEIAALITSNEESIFKSLALRDHPKTGKEKSYPFVRIKLKVNTTGKLYPYQINDIRMSTFHLFGRARTDSHTQSFATAPQPFAGLDFTLYSDDKLFFKYHDDLGTSWFKNQAITEVRLNFREIPVYRVSQ